MCTPAWLCLTEFVCVCVIVWVWLCECMRVCMCLYVYVCVRMYGMCMHKCSVVYMCVRLCMYMYAYACMYMYVPVRVYVWICVYLYVYACVWLCMYVSDNVYVCPRSGHVCMVAYVGYTNTNYDYDTCWLLILLLSPTVRWNATAWLLLVADVGGVSSLCGARWLWCVPFCASPYIYTAHSCYCVYYILYVILMCQCPYVSFVHCE